jgi:CheY-like chemotaxis protein
VTGVLIVDDDPNTRRKLRVILEALSHSVLEAGNGREALPLVEQHKPDLMIVDIVMPEMDGLETIRMLRRKGHRMPIIAMPLRADSAEKRYSKFARSFGADEVLLKPFVDTDVMEVVARALGQVHPSDTSGTTASA